MGSDSDPLGHSAACGRAVVLGHPDCPDVHVAIDAAPAVLKKLVEAGFKIQQSLDVVDRARDQLIDHVREVITLTRGMVDCAETVIEPPRRSDRSWLNTKPQRMGRTRKKGRR